MRGGEVDLGWDGMARDGVAWRSVVRNTMGYLELDRIGGRRNMGVGWDRLHLGFTQGRGGWEWDGIGSTQGSLYTHPG